MSQLIVPRRVDDELKALRARSLYGAGAPSGAGVDGQEYWDSTNKRLYRSDGTGWRLIGGSMPRCLAYLSAAQAIANNTNQNVLWDTELYDTDAIHSISTNKARMTIPAGLGGIWRADYAITFAANGTGTRAAWLLVNGTGRRYAFQEFPPNAGVNGACCGSKDIVLADADFVELYVYQLSGGFLNVALGTNDCLSMTYIGPS